VSKTEDFLDERIEAHDAGDAVRMKKAGQGEFDDLRSYRFVDSGNGLEAHMSCCLNFMSSSSKSILFYLT